MPCGDTGAFAADATQASGLLAGIAGLVAGSMSMAAGEYVSVHSQADTEAAELARERAELKADDKGEQRELTAIYVGRGLEPAGSLLQRGLRPMYCRRTRIPLCPKTGGCTARAPLHRTKMMNRRCVSAAPRQTMREEVHGA